MVEIAVKVTLLPGHIAPDGLAEITALTGAAGLTFIVKALDVAGDPEEQGAFEVITQVTTSPFEMPEEV